MKFEDVNNEFLVTFKSVHKYAKRIIENDMVLGFQCEHDLAVLEKFAKLWAKKLDLESKNEDFLASVVRATRLYDDYEFHILLNALKNNCKQ